jgi:nucleoid-associated protein EbfC
MLKGLGNLASMLRQAQQFGGKMEAINVRLKSERVTAGTGGGMVEVEANGLGEIVRVSIDPALVERGDREMIEDLLPGAINQAVVKARQLHMEAMQSLTEGFNMPGLADLVSKMTAPDADEDEQE